MPINAINDTGVKYLYDKLHGEIEPVAEAVSDSEVTIEGNPLSFNTLSSQNAKSTILSVEPIQDLHGYDKPWVGGAGKNLYIGSPSFDNYDGDGWEKDTSTYNGHEVYKKALAWNGLYKEIYLDVGTYTFSLYIKGDSAASVNVELVGKGATATVTNGTTLINVSATWERRNVTFNVTVAGTVTCRIQKTTSDSNFIYISEYQLEKNSQATSYSPYENICTITGRTEIGILGCGKNLYDISKDELGYIDLTNGAEAPSNNTYRSDFIYLYGKKKLTLNLPNSTNLRAAYYDKNKTFVSSDANNNAYPQTITIPNNAEYLRFYSGNNTNGKLEEGTQATPYSPYTKSNNLTINLGQTVYGGTLDVENGVLVVTDGRQDLGALNWYLSSSANVFYSSISGCYKGSGETIICCDSYIKANNRASASNVASYNPDFSLCGISDSTSASDRIFLKNSLYDDATNLKNSLDGVYAIYKLATPITINLTPHTINLLKGVNNISVDDSGASVTLTYRDGSVATLGDVKALGDEMSQEIADSQILTDTVTGDKYKLVVTSGVLSIEQISN